MSDNPAFPLSIWIPSEPVPKGRHRMTKTGISYTPKATSQYETWVRWMVVAELNEHPDWVTPLEGPLGLTLCFRLPRPKSVSQKKRPMPSVRPDLDNLVKAVMDGISQSGLWKDDSQVVGITSEKLYTERGRPGCLIVVQQLQGVCSWVKIAQRQEIDLWTRILSQHRFSWDLEICSRCNLPRPEGHAPPEVENYDSQASSRSLKLVKEK